MLLLLLACVPCKLWCCDFSVCLKMALGVAVVVIAQLLRRGCDESLGTADMD